MNRTRTLPTIAVLAALCILAANSSAAEKPPAIEGNYRCTGANPDGQGEYKGTVKISKQDNVYHLEWSIGDQSHKGVGLLNGDLLSVSWMSSNEAGIVVYKIEKGDKGPKLSGKWTAIGGSKLGTETLEFDK